jgi:hypothetical protein
MEIKSLENTSPLEIYQCFKSAFTDYVIPLELDQNMTLERWKLAGVDYQKSYGAFDNGECIGFILNLNLGDTLYNFGTGVTPAHRGKQLVTKIYEKLPKFDYYSLEVIKENVRAFHLYQKLGFVIERELISVTGTLEITEETNKNLTYRVLPLSYNPSHEAIRLFNLSAENSMATLMLHPTHYELHEIKAQNELKAYAIYHPATASLRGIGAAASIAENLDQLFIKMKLSGEKVRVMNIDLKARTVLDYFQERGLEILVAQYEMLKKSQH